MANSSVAARRWWRRRRWWGGGGGGWGGGGGGGGGGGPSCSPHECVGGGIVAVPKLVEGKPLIQWLILRGKASVLKQFFAVSEVVQNSRRTHSSWPPAAPH